MLTLQNDRKGTYFEDGHKRTCIPYTCLINIKLLNTVKYLCTHNSQTSKQSQEEKDNDNQVRNYDIFP